MVEKGNSLITQKAIDKMVEARKSLLSRGPFFAATALNTPIRADYVDTEVMKTNGKELVFNPNEVLRRSFENVVGINVHEYMHIDNKHHIRIAEILKIDPSADLELINCAADLAINGPIMEAGYDLTDGLHEPELDGKSLEEIYRVLKQRAKKDKEGTDKMKEQSKLSGGLLMPMPGTDPSGNPDPTMMPTEEEIGKEEQRVKGMVMQGIALTDKFGTMPGGMNKMIDDILNPKPTINEAIRMFMVQHCANDYSYAFPNPKFIPLGLYMPTRWGEQLPKLYLVMDCSGSVSDEWYKMFGDIMTGVLEEYHETTLKVIYFDTEVYEGKEYGYQDLPIKLERFGGGGTDFVPVFDWVEKQDGSAAGMIFMTDLCCNNYPDRAPEYPVLWAHIGNRGSQPPFGELVRVME